MSMLGLARFVLGAAAASLTGSALFGLLLLATPLSDWMGLFSNPLNACGYVLAFSPQTLPCLGGLYVDFSLRLAIAAAVLCGPAWWALRRTQWAGLPALLAVGAAGGSLAGLAWKLGWLVRGGTLGQLLSPGFRELVLAPQLWALLNCALVGAALGLVMAATARLFTAGPAKAST